MSGAAGGGLPCQPRVRDARSAAAPASGTSLVHVWSAPGLNPDKDAFEAAACIGLAVTGRPIRSLSRGGPERRRRPRPEGTAHSHVDPERREPERLSGSSDRAWGDPQWLALRSRTSQSPTRRALRGQGQRSGGECRRASGPVRDVRARLAMVGAPQADRRDRELPSHAPAVLPVWPHAGRDE